MNPNQQTWNISADAFPEDETAASKLEFMLHYAVLAPSTHNTQPWQFLIHGYELELHADPRRALRVVDPGGRQMVLSCGAALFHLRVAMQYFGYGGQITLLPDPADTNLLARLRLGFKCETSAEDLLLFNAIPRRRTNRSAFRRDPVPAELLTVLRDAAASEGAWFQVIEDETRRGAVADLVAEADRIQWSQRAFREELAHWVHPNRSEFRDGMPGYALGLDDLKSYAGPLVIRTFDRGAGQAAKDREVALYSPVLAVLGTVGDAPADWLTAGQALAKVLLRAREDEVWASFLNQPIQVEELRPQLAELTGLGGSPQVLLRLGFGEEVRPTPRRAVHEVLVKPHGPTAVGIGHPSF